MTDQTQSEFELLKQQAKTLGINPGNMGVDALKKKIEARLSEDAGSSEDTPQAEAPRALTKAEREMQLRADLRKEKLRQMRVQIHNLNPNKAALQGEFISVGNRYIGNVKKFVPFGEMTDGGYHVPKVIYDELKNRKFQQIRVRKVRGRDVPDTRLVPEYNIVDLPQLTKAELQELAMNQEAARRAGLE